MNQTDRWNAAQQALAHRQWASAARAFADVVAHDAHQAQAWMGMGMAHLELKQYRQALTALEQAQALAPDDPYVMANLASVWRVLGKLEAAAQMALHAAQRLPDEPLVQLNCCLIEQAFGRLDQALEGYAALTRRWPTLGVAHYHLGHVQLILGQLAASEHSLRQCLALNRRNEAAQQALFAVHLRQNRHQEALAEVEGWLRHQPHDIYLLALRCIALRHVGRDQEAAVLDDARNWLQVCQLRQPPMGWNSVPDFNAAILRHVQQHPELGTHTGQATANGQRVEDVLAAPQGPVDALAHWTLSQLRIYLDGMRDRPHPFGRLIEGDFALRGWAVLMHEGGHETPHLHPGGVLSCVYYPALPEVVRSDQDQAGNLCFGEPDPLFAPQGSASFGVAPQEGMLLIFPSWLWHHTVPFFSERPRLSLAFDLYPQPRAT